MKRIAVDLDGTLAKYTHWPKDGSIGEPVPDMVDRVKKWLDEGHDVVIFTARVCSNDEYSEESKRLADEIFVEEQTKFIQEWCLKHIGKVLPITNKKDFKMVEFWDDRAKQVYPNTGELVEDRLKMLNA